MIGDLPEWLRFISHLQIDQEPKCTLILVHLGLTLVIFSQGRLVNSLWT